MNFAELGIGNALIAALVKESIHEPTPIQTEAIPPLLAGKDAYIAAETGTGKTLAYLLPLFGRIDSAVPWVQAVVLAPTRELASQIHQQALRLAQNSGLPIKSLLLIGGANPKRQLDKLKEKPHLVVGSSGRILELARAKKLKLAQVATVVVDEADRQLAGEHLNDVRAIAALVPANRQMVFVSATGKAGAMAEARRLAPGLKRLDAAANRINPDIRHLYVVCEERDKPDLLRRLFHAARPERAIVFVHRNTSAELVAAKLAHYRIPAVDLHAAKGKLERKQALDAVRTGKAKVLIASDVAARGIDIKGATHVFNFDVPTASLDYLHRAGRTGRAGSAGTAISLMSLREVRLARRYEHELGIRMVEAFVREGRIVEQLAADPADAAGE